MDSDRVLPRSLSWLVLVSCIACGDYATDAALHPEPQAGADFSAVIDGVPWTGSAATTKATAEAGGVFRVSGMNADVTTSIAVNLGGHFDLPVVASASIDVPEDKGGAMTGTIGTASWNAAMYFANTTASTNSIRVFAYNTAYTVSINVSGFAGVGTYNLNTDVARWASVTLFGGPGSWGGASPELSSGTFVVTSTTRRRIKGTYNFSLHRAAAATTTDDITMSGTFDLGVTPGN